MRYKPGYVTVFFTIALSLCLSLIIGLIYGARENALREKTKEAAAVSIKSVMAEYQKELWQEFNLIFVDSGYGYNADSLSLTEEHYIGFLNHNFDEEKLGLINGKDLLKLSCVNAETDRVRFATDNSGAAVFNQAVTCMKYKYGIEYINSLYETATSSEMETLINSESVESLVRETKEDLDEIIAPVFKPWTEEIDDSVLSEKELSFLSTLRLVLDSVEDVSKTVLNEDSLLENREINEGNFENSELEKALTDQLFFKEYVLNYCSNYINKSDDRALSYEVEYLIKGNLNDSHNLEAVVNKILLIREAANMISLYLDTERINEINAIVETAMALLTLPELAPALTALVVAVWSYFESISDVKTIMFGGKVPLIKSHDEWRTGIFGSNKNKSENYGAGLDYKAYLRVLLYFSDTDTLLKRFLNVVDMDVRKISKNTHFSLDNCFDAVEMTAYVVSDYGYSYQIKRNYIIGD